MKRAIVTGGTKSDAAAMAVLAINIRDTNADVFDQLIIYHDGISKRLQKLIASFFPTEFIEYHLPYRSQNDEIVNHFSPMVFCKYECLKLLERFDEVAWIDYDVVIRGNLACGMDFSSSEFNYMRGKIKLRDMFFAEIENPSIYSYDLEKVGFHASFFSVSSKMEAAPAMYDFCYARTKEWDRDLYLPEQCVFAAMLQEYDVKMKYLDEAVYSCLPEDEHADALILHAIGPAKFWNGRENEMWNARYQEWISAGGCKYHKKWNGFCRKAKFLWTRMWGMRGKSIR